MKKLLIPFILVAAVLFQSCKGPQGEPGLDGLDGDLLIGQTYEVKNVNFTAPNYEFVQTYTAAKLVTVQPSDAVLVYILWDVTSNNNPIWRLLPQAIDMPRGVVYNFDYTPADFSVFIEAPSNVNKATLTSDFTQNQTLRVVVIPSDFTGARKSGPAVDANNYEAVKQYYHLDESKIPAVVAN